MTQRFKGAFVLDRWSDTNLGATLPATEANVNSANYRDTWGNFYQWGRNVGFPHGVTYKVITTNPSITAEMRKESIDDRSFSSKFTEEGLIR